MTAVVKERDIPKWSESFDIPVTDADSDLVTVQLLHEMEAGHATTGPPLPSPTTIHPRVESRDLMRFRSTFGNFAIHSHTHTHTHTHTRTGNMEETSALGHVAVPVARVRATGTEEGWYELRARDGEFIMGGMFLNLFCALYSESAVCMQTRVGLF